MAKGAKPGENRFKGAQILLVSYRSERLREIVAPKLRTLSANINVNSLNKFLKLASDTYNDDLPINEKPISPDTIKKNNDYWKIIGPIYFRSFANKENLDAFKKSAVSSLNSQKVKELETELKVLKSENDMFKSQISFENLIALSEVDNDKDNHLKDIDSLCKIIKHLIKLSGGVISVSKEDMVIRDLSDDLEGKNGMLPKEIVEPYLRWLKDREEKFGGFDE